MVCIDLFYFPQAKLDSEIKVSFVLNEHGNLHFFYCIIIVLYVRHTLSIPVKFCS